MKAPKDSNPIENYVYRDAKTEEAVMVVDVESDNVTYITPDNKWKSCSLSQFKKGFTPGKVSDYDMFESEIPPFSENAIGFISINESIYPIKSKGNSKIVCIDETGEKFVIELNILNESDINEASLSVTSKGVTNGKFVLDINGTDYSYTSDTLSSEDLEKKYLSIAKHSIGKALTWIKKNAKTLDSKKKKSI